MKRLLRHRYRVMMCVGPHPPTLTRHHRVEYLQARTRIGAQLAVWLNGHATLGLGWLEVERIK